MIRDKRQRYTRAATRMIATDWRLWLAHRLLCCPACGQVTGGARCADARCTNGRRLVGCDA